MHLEPFVLGVPVVEVLEDTAGAVFRLETIGLMEHNLGEMSAGYSVVFDPWSSRRDESTGESDLNPLGWWTPDPLRHGRLNGGRALDF